MIKKGTPALLFTPDQVTPMEALRSSAATGLWRLGLVSAWRTSKGRRIIDAIDGTAVQVLDGWTHTLAPDVAIAISITPVDERPEIRALVGSTWPDGASVFSELDAIRSAAAS